LRRTLVQLALKSISNTSMNEHEASKNLLSL